MRPTVRQEREAREGFRAMDADEASLRSRVMDALDEIPGIDVEINRETVILRGKVIDVALITRAEQIAREVDGVGGVVNRLVVAG